jgi:hypothetical protein
MIGALWCFAKPCSELCNKAGLTPFIIDVAELAVEIEPLSFGAIFIGQFYHRMSLSHYDKRQVEVSVSKVE